MYTPDLFIELRCVEKDAVVIIYKELASSNVITYSPNLRPFIRKGINTSGNVNFATIFS